MLHSAPTVANAIGTDPAFVRSLVRRGVLVPCAQRLALPGKPTLHFDADDAAALALLDAVRLALGSRARIYAALRPVIAMIQAGENPTGLHLFVDFAADVVHLAELRTDGRGLDLEKLTAEARARVAKNLAL